mmetsp:Transcript_8697/g.20696  ORF Transcript_8697/g.20696 Transcript_8697/m.20696 type:complete len:524 (+) Transcript_8697:59-1630(+)
MAWLALAALASSLPHPTRGVPNILFLMADQFRFDAMGPESTPNLHEHLKEGAQFLSHYSSTPSCTPARAGILTGRSPWNHGMLGYGEIADGYRHELVRSMRAAGLRAVVVGKNHYGWDEVTGKPVAHDFEDLQIYDGLGNGFRNGSEFDNYDAWFQLQKPGQNPLKSGGLDWNSWRGAAYEYEEPLHPTAWTGLLAREALRSLASGTEPFFLKVSFHRPHSPYDPPARLLTRTDAPNRPPAVARDGWDQQLRNCDARGSPDAWCGEVNEDALNLTRRAYMASVKFVDEQIGSILDLLQQLRLSKNTFILFTSDHGDMQMDHFLWRKTYPYEGSAHVPLWVRWPESQEAGFRPRGQSVRAVTELRDLYPTFLDVVGQWNTTMEAQLDGRPLTWLLKDKATAPWRAWVDLEHDRIFNVSNHWNALTDGVMKFILYACSGGEQLFNLTADPYETQDLSGDPQQAEALALWRRRMIAQFESEARGADWVQNGSLQRRCASCLYSRNYPQPTEHCRKVPRQRATLVSV